MLKELILNYKPVNEQEIVDRETFLKFITNNENYLNRSNTIAHVTTSVIIVNEKMTKMLFAYHLIYNSWAWLGGHNDGDDDCLRVALKEATEESGIKNFKVLIDKPIMIDIINVTNHIKNGKYVSDHLHLNVTYLLQTNESETLHIKKDENSGLKWFKINEIMNYVTEERMKPIYQKAIIVIKKIRKSV